MKLYEKNRLWCGAGERRYIKKTDRQAHTQMDKHKETEIEWGGERRK